MTFFNIKNNDFFVTRIQFYPYFDITDSFDYSVINDYAVCNSSSIVLRTYRDNSHYYYRSTYEDPEKMSSASIIFYQNVTESRSNVLWCLSNYYSNYSTEYETSMALPPQALHTGGLHVVSIPRAFYGKEIVKTSFYITDVSTSDEPAYVKRVVFDNGSGSLYYKLTDLTGTLVSSSVKIGNIFYYEGLAFISSTDFTTGLYPLTASDYQIQFSGTHNVYTLNTFCHVGQFENAFSNNSSSYTTSSDGASVKVYTGSDDRTWATGIGLYDENYKLIGSAKFSSPVRKLPSDKMLYKLRCDF